MNYYKFKTIISLLIIAMIFPIFSFATESVYVWSNNEEAVQTSMNITSDTTNSLNLESGSAILIEQNSGQVLYEHNVHEQLRPASVTKVMTILLIMEALDEGRITLDTKIPCSEEAASMGGSQIWLDTTETLTVNEMLKAICVVSANDCTVAMAEYLGGTTSAFVDMMNEKAKELGMNDTCFKNCHGLDEDGHVTSSYDIALMSRELLTKHPDIKNYTTIYMDSLRDGKSELVNTNKLVRNYSGCTGLKTGSTSLALFNLSASATRDDLSLIAVIMKGPTSAKRFAEAQKLLDYGFNNYSYKEFGKQGDVVQSISVSKGLHPEVEACLEESSFVLVKKEKLTQIEQEVVLENNINAPVSAGQKLGEVHLTSNGERISSVNLVAKNEVKKLSFWSMTSFVAERWFNLLR